MNRITQNDIDFLKNLNHKYHILHTNFDTEMFSKIESFLLKIYSNRIVLENIALSYKYNFLYDIDEYIPEISCILRNNIRLDSSLFWYKKSIYDYEHEIRGWIINRINY